MRIQGINCTNVFPKNHLNFTSKVVHVRSNIEVPISVKDFIDDFEEECPKNEKGKRDAEGYQSGAYVITKTSKGESANTYFVKNTNSAMNGFAENFVIKESNPLKHKYRGEYDYGGLGHEYDMADTIHKIVPFYTQKPLAYMSTEDGGHYMLSEKMNIEEDFGFSSKSGDKSKSGKSGIYIDPDYLRTAFGTLEKMNEKNIFDPDLTRGNVQRSKDDGDARLLDFQWAHSYNSYYGPTSIQSFCFAPNENINNIAPFEANLLADHLVALQKAGKDKAEIRDVLKDYLKMRSKYEERSEDFDVSVFENPSDDILDAELLRLAFLRNHRLQFLYTDDNIEKPRNMMKLVGYTALASYAAKALKDFEPQYSPKNENERKYFEFMKEYGKYMYDQTKSWYPSTVNYLKNVAKGDDKAPGRFFPEKFERTALDSEFSHFNLLSDNSSVYQDWIQCDKGEEMIETNVNNIEKTIMKLYKGKTDNYNYEEFNKMLYNLYS